MQNKQENPNQQSQVLGQDRSQKTGQTQQAQPSQSPRDSQTARTQEAARSDSASGEKKSRLATEEDDSE